MLLPGINLTSFIAPNCHYPESFSVSLVSLGGKTPMSFSVLPAELTRTMWWRVRKALEGSFPSLGKVVPIGLANDYIAYVTTPEEYGAQGYEGASDIFGPSTGDVLREVSCDLAGELRPPVTSPRRVTERRFYPDWKTESFGPEWLGVAYSDADEGARASDRGRQGRREPALEERPIPALATVRVVRAGDRSLGRYGESSDQYRPRGVRRGPRG